ncbi:MAG: hypothetical protein AABY64_06340 [Bdellovibrionota bacterium]
MHIERSSEIKIEPKPFVAARSEKRALRKVEATIVAVEEITPIEQERMYAIFSKYYINHNRNTFLDDLYEKDHVIMLRDKENKTIQGFSTLLKVSIKSGRSHVTGIFSGDTVLEKEYWGNKALGVAFLRYLWIEKIKNPFRPVFWFLISKGYKTYLLMANNFQTHFPRFEMATPPRYQKIMDSFYSKKFPQYYRPEKGLIEFESHSCSLKEKVAEISLDLLKNQRVQFFTKMNPHWDRGFELACLSEMTILMPLKYFFKKILIQKRKK